jgi:hypothetical protein
MRKFLPLLLACFMLLAQSLEARQQTQALTMASVNEAEWQDDARRGNGNASREMGMPPDEMMPEEGVPDEMPAEEMPPE